MSSVQSVETQVAGHDVFYKFTCQFTYAQSESIQAVYAVYYQTQTSQMTISSSYPLQVISNSGGNSYEL